MDRSILVLSGIFVFGAFRVFSQTPSAVTPAGQNAVYAASSATVSTQAFVDAGQFANTNGLGTDLCLTIHYILTTLYTSTNATGIVVDARGFPQASGTYTCSSNPWSGVVANNMSDANVILLPAGTISIQTTWTLAQSTRLIGQGTKATVIQATGFSGDMIDMGSQAACPEHSSVVNGVTNTVYDCTGVSVEHLTLDGNSIAGVNGIVNNYGEELSYVKDVAMINIKGTGLSLGVTLSATATTTVSSSSANSGPYSNISFSGVGTSPICANINLTKVVTVSGSPVVESVSDTRGIQGMSCTSSSKSTNAAIYLDGPNNLIEDVYINNFAEGIFVGSNNHAENNTLSNIRGDNVTNLVELSSATSASSGCPTVSGVTPNNVCDLTQLGLSTTGNLLFLDDASSSSLPSSTDPTLGIYVTGELQPGAGTSRLTTSLSSPAGWLVGTTAPSGTCQPGAIYSCTTGCTSTTGTIWACTASAAWHLILK
jgi:hypothetical protein